MLTPEVIFEDNHVIVAIKPAGVLSQADGSDAPDMLTLLKEYIKVKYNKPGNVYLGLLHRLDRPVSGVMVFAKTSKAASRINEQIRSHKMLKKYRAVVEGVFTKPSGRIENYCTKDSKTNNTKVTNKPISKDSKLSVLEYETISSGEYKGKKVTLVDIHLETGRSHQIRTQMEHSGHALLGDARYGSGLYKGDICLESYKLGFNHPTTGEYMEFTKPMETNGPWGIFA